MTKCKGCGAEIIWIKTINGKSMPCDAQEVFFKATKNGKQTYITKDGETLRGEPTDTLNATNVGYVSHWATCPQFKKFKKDGK